MHRLSHSSGPSCLTLANLRIHISLALAHECCEPHASLYSILVPRHPSHQGLFHPSYYYIAC
ncbi:hypothetical protein RSAG8_13336, partial [Rhizoctonia solani AG-8 WAC10335]